MARRCPCEYCEQHRKHDRPPEEWSWPWFLTVAGIVVGLTVAGLCVAFLMGPR